MQDAGVRRSARQVGKARDEDLHEQRSSLLMSGSPIFTRTVHLALTASGEASPGLVPEGARASVRRLAMRHCPGGAAERCTRWTIRRSPCRGRRGRPGGRCPALLPAGARLRSVQIGGLARLPSACSTPPRIRRLDLDEADEPSCPQLQHNKMREHGGCAVEGLAYNQT